MLPMRVLVSFGAAVSARASLLSLLCLGLAGCSFVVDFDRSQVENRQADGGDGDGDTDGGQSNMDAGMDGSMAALDASASCANDRECGTDQLCCNSTCVNTTVAECTGCGLSCPANLANACVNRTCVCGDGDLCAGGTEERFCVGTPAACAGCRDSNDCGGTTPICNATTRQCQGCNVDNNDCSGTLICQVGGACGGCTGSADCQKPDEPICNTTSTLCEPCSGDGASAACQAAVGKPYCVDSTKCSVCRPDTDQGCVADSTTPDCRLDTTTNQYACQGCTATSCQGERDMCDTTTGKCLECKAHADCTNANEPLCDMATGTCRPCDDQADGDNLCGAKNGSTCNDANGRCVECDAPAQCSTPEPYCQDNMCVECTEQSQCTNEAEPACIGFACSPCTADEQCPAARGQCVAGRCRACDPTSGQANAGCENGQFCHPDSFTCVACLTSADCTTSPTAPICSPSNTCVGCANDTECMAKTAGSVCATAGGPTVAGRCGSCDPADSEQCTTAAAPVCNGDTLSCVPCTDVVDRDAACAAKGGPATCVSAAGALEGQCSVCDPAGDTSPDQGCSASLPICVEDGATTDCVECTVAGDCTSNPKGTLCLPAQVCGCTAAPDDGCPDGQVCDSVSGTCMPE